MNQPNTPHNALQTIRDALEKHGRRITKETPQGFRSSCPAHDGDGPNLAVYWKQSTPGEVGLTCHSRGCDSDDVLAAIGLDWRDRHNNPPQQKETATPRSSLHSLIERKPTMTKNDATTTPTRGPGKNDRYEYPDGRIVHVTRYNDGDKNFHQENAQGKRSLYRVEEVRQAAKAGAVVYLVEGEKDVHTLEGLGCVATTNAAGSGNLANADLSPLKGAHVVAVVDRDEAGDKWAATVRERLTGKAASLAFKQAATTITAKGADFTDHHEAGGTVDTLEVYTPSAAREATRDREEPTRRGRITWASEIEPEPVVWAWEPNGEGRIPAGSLSIAAGREGTGKSSFGIWLAAQITSGTLPGAFNGTPRRVLYVAVEDSWKHTLVPRLMAAGADLSKVGRFDVVVDELDEATLSLPSDNALLEQAVREQGVALVVLDPLMSVIGDRIDTHRERDVRSALDPLAKLADRTGTVLLGIAHFNKGSGEDVASLITGSGAFKNVPRSVFGFIRDVSDENGGRIMSQAKNSLGRDDLPSWSYRIESVDIETKNGVATTGKFALVGASSRSVSDVLRDSRHGSDDPEDRREVDAWLRGYIADAGGTVKARDAIRDGRKEGFQESQLKKARMRAGIKTAREGFGKGSSNMWTIDSPIGSIDSNPQELGTYGTYVESMEKAQPVAQPGDSTKPDLSQVVDEGRPLCPVCTSRRMSPTEVKASQCNPCRNVGKWTPPRERGQSAS